MSREVKAAIKKCNKLKRYIKKNRREWVEAYKSVLEEIRNAKKVNWKEFQHQGRD